MKTIVITFLILFLAGPLLAAQGFSSLEEQMTGKEFQDAGLDKLTDQELSALNYWIRRHSLATLDTPQGAAAATAAVQGGEDNRGFDQKDKKDKEDGPIHSRIAGAFTGWDGQTIFKLENGMIWAQADKDKFYTRAVQSPEVTISKSLFGAWHLSVAEFDSKCKVRRIQ